MNVMQTQDHTLFELEDREFLKRAYRLLLGRVPDAQGLRGYLDQLKTGVSKQAIYEALAASDEARNLAAKRQTPRSTVAPRPVAVEAVVAPAASVLAPAVEHAVVPECLPVPAVADVDELVALDGLVFIKAAYLAVLGREADDEGLQNYLRLLRDGWSKMHVLQGLSGSEEGRAAARALPGLKTALLRYIKAQRRSWGGWYYRSVLGVESDMPIERQLRAAHAALRRG